MVQTHQNTPHEDVVLFQIAHQMKDEGLSESFIAAAIRTALEYEGEADLVTMWSEEEDPKERGEIIADIQEMIDACSQPLKLEYPIIKFNDLDTVAKHIRELKDSLLQKVNEEGGVSHLAKLTGIPQSSLS